MPIKSLKQNCQDSFPMFYKVVCDKRTEKTAVRKESKQLFN